MRNFSRLLVYLTLTKTDEILIKYVDFLQNKLGPFQQIFFLHNIQYDFLSEAKSFLDHLDQPLATYIQKDLEEKIQQILPYAENSIHIQVTSNSSTASSIAQSAASQQSDLILLGKQMNQQHAHILNSKLLRETPCSVLFLPDTAYHTIHRILVPIDFSKHSMFALITAQHIVSMINAYLACQHVYRIPNHYFPYISWENVEEKLLKKAKHKYQKFLENARLDQQEIQCAFTLSRNKSIIQNIYLHATHEKFDFIIMGARGNNLQVGSVAQGLSAMPSHIPIMVIKST